ncbi:hypothetical protein GCM10007392_14680 [Saccharospirillum salsuginis]|uniref:Uncharacterized protein n=1 Tax=Saccharospirillum salsuginis TaxID=418750 RepID=A0A918K5V1_9GAMM|nr:hypothetical protein GCM10007392_14680 [Saccharospirillum salsuginis]
MVRLVRHPGIGAVGVIRRVGVAHLFAYGIASATALTADNAVARRVGPLLPYLEVKPTYVAMV